MSATRLRFARPLNLWFSSLIASLSSTSTGTVGRSLSTELEVSRRAQAWTRSIALLGATLLLLGVVCVSAQAQSLGNWNQESPATSPGGRWQSSMAYDAGHGQVVLFGGFTSGQLGDTWLWNGTTWTEQSPATNPPARDQSAMVYDAAQGQVVLFGGYVSNSAPFRSNDTWVWNGTTWSEESPATSPSARADHAMAYDALHSQAVLFGGFTDTGTTLGDTWLWSGTTWIQQSPATNPPARYFSAMAYDAIHNQVVMFGGQPSSSGGALGDTWVWDGTNWTQLSPANSPVARYGHTMSFDAQTGQIVLFGGEDAGNNYLPDTWVWDGTNWTPAITTNSPAARAFHSAAYDAAQGQVVLFGGTGASLFNDTWEFASAGNFGNVNVCPAGQTTPAPCSNTLTLTYSFTATTTFGTPTVLTQGTNGLDFTLGSSNTCTGTISAGNSCTVQVTFAPIAPGLRLGAVQLFDNGSPANLLATTPIYGIGEGPSVAFGPGTQTTVPTSGLHYNVGVATDGSGNLYIADYHAGKVVEVTPGGVQTTVLSAYTSAPGHSPAPVGVAVDGAGDLFIVDLGLPYAVKLTPGGVQTTVGSGLSSPIGVAVDGAGDVFIGDQNNNRVVEVTASGAQTTVPATGLNQVWGVAVDGAGDVFIADGANQRVVEVTPGGVQSTVPATGLKQPYDVAVDAAGDVFIADPQNGRVVEVSPSGVQTTVGSGLNYPSGVTVDAAGHVHIGDQGLGEVFEVNRSQPPSLTFATTNVGSTSSDSPQSITIQNIGNQTLNSAGSGLVVGSNFAEVPGSGTPADCTSSFSLAAGATCNLSISFEPLIGGNPDTSTAVLTDNALNNAAATQTVTLSGIANGPGPAFVPPGSGITVGSGSGTPVNLGNQFTANANIWVTSLGFYAENGAPAFGNNETVTLYDGSGNPLASTVVSHSGTVTDGYYWQNISPIQLTAGQAYTVSAFVGNNSWAYGGVPSAPSQVTYTGHAYAYGNGPTFPTQTAAQNGQAYYGPNLTFATSNPIIPITTCGTQITASGIYSLQNDLTNCSFDGIDINANDVTLNLNGHLISQASGASSECGLNGIAVGFSNSLTPVSNVTIIGPGSITGFNNGVLFSGVSNSTVTGVTAVANSDGFALNQTISCASSGPAHSTNNTFTNNNANYNGAGFLLQFADTNTFSNNLASYNAGEGFFLSSGNNNTLTFNNTSANGLRGIAVANGRTGNIFQFNTARGNPGDYDIEDDNTTCVNTYSSNIYGTSNSSCVGNSGNATETGLTLSDYAPVSGESLTLTANVSFSQGPVDSGSVTFTDFGNVIATVPVITFGTNAGQASATATLAVGGHALQAWYGTSGGYVSSTSGPIGVIVSPATPPTPTPVTTCGTSLSAAGSYILQNDLTNCSGDGIDITANNVTLNLNGHTMTGSNPNYAVKVWSGTAAPISNVIVLGPGTLTGGWSTGVYMEQATNSVVSGITSTGNQYGINANASFDDGLADLHTSSSLFINNVITHNSVNGISLNGADNSVFQNNSISNSSQDGLVLFETVGDIAVGNTTIQNTQDGVQAFQVSSCSNSATQNTGCAAGNTIINNTAQSNTSTDLLDATTPCANGWSGNVFASTNESACIRILPSVLTVTTNNLSMTAGSPVPQLTYGITGFVFPDTASIVSGVPALSTTATSASAPGTYPITVTYGTMSAPSYRIQFAAGTLTVNAATTTLLQSSFNPSIIGQPTTFMATVSSNGSPVSVGTVTFYDATTAISSPIALSGAGTAAFTTNALSAGTHFITALYSGGGGYPSSQGVLTQNVSSTITPQTPPSLPGLTSTFTGGTSPTQTDTFITPYQINQTGYITSWQTEYVGQTVAQGPVIPAGVQLKIFRQTVNGLEAVAAGPVDDPRPILQQRFGAAYPNFPYSQSLITFNDPPLPVQSGDFVGVTIYAAVPPSLYEYPMVGPQGTLQVQRDVVVGQYILPTDPATFSVANPPALNFTVTASGALSPLSLENNYFVTGDYSAAAVAMRGTGVSGTATATITIPSSSQDPVNGVPTGADGVDALLYWQTLENTKVASESSVVFNGFTVYGQQIGSDLAYTDGTVSGTLRMYRADVNAYFLVANTTNGERNMSGSFSVSLPDSGGTGLPLAEGAGLVVVYRVLSPNFPLKSVVIYDGSATPTASGVLQAVQGFYDPNPSGVARAASIYTPTGGSWGILATTPGLQYGQSVFENQLGTGAWGVVALSTPVNSSDGDGLLDAWKRGPSVSDFHAGQPGYYAVQNGSWVPLPGALHGEKDLFIQLDWMCGNILTTGMSAGTCDPTQEDLFPSPDAYGNDPLAIATQSFLNRGIHAHFVIGNIIPEDTCTDNLTTNPPQLCEFPVQPGATAPPAGIVSWKNSLEFYKAWPKNIAACITGGDCTPRFPIGQKDSYHYVLFAHALAVPAWNSRFNTVTSIVVSNNVTTIVTADRGQGIQMCPSRITIAGVLGNPMLNGVYNVASCANSMTMTINTPGVPNWTYPNASPEPLIGITSGIISSISGYSDLGGQDSVVSLGLWETAPMQDMSKRVNVTAGTLFHEVGHTLALPHGGLYFDTPGSYAPTFEANCKPNYQSVMNYLFQLDLLGPTHVVDYSGQTLETLNESNLTPVNSTGLVDTGSNPAAVGYSAWYVPNTANSGISSATLHCDGTAVPTGSSGSYRVDEPVVSTISPAWSNGQDINYDGQLNTQMRGYNDWANVDLRQVGATGGEYASIASSMSFGGGSPATNVSAGGTVALGSGGTVALGSGGTVTLGSGGNVTLGSGGTIALGSGGTVTLGSGGTVVLGSGGTVTPGSDGNVALGSGGTYALSIPGTITLGSGGTVALGSGGTVTLGSGGSIALTAGGTVALGSGGQYTIPSTGGTITLGSGGNVTLGSGGTVVLGSGGTVALGSGGTVTLSSGGLVTLGSGGLIALGSGGTVALGSGGNVTLGSGGLVTLGSGGTVTLGSGGTVTLGSGGTIALGSGGNVALGSGGLVVLGSGGTVALGSGGTVALGSGGTVTLSSAGTIALGSGGNVTLGSGGSATLPAAGGNVVLGSGGTVTLGSGGTVTLSSAGTVTLGSGGTSTPIAANTPTAIAAGGTVALGSGGTVALGSGGLVALGSGGTIALGSGGTIALGSGGTVVLGSGGLITLGSGGTVALGSGGNVALGSGGLIALGSGGNVTLGSDGLVALGSGGNVTLGSGGNTLFELDYNTANSVVRPPVLPTYQLTGPSSATINWTAPEFGVVATYTIFRVITVNGVPQGTPVAIGSVSGVNGNPPATSFTDPNVPTTPPGGSVVYTITTTLVPDAGTNQQRQSPPSAPAVLSLTQTITFGPLPSSVQITNSPLTVTATAMSGGSPNGLQVSFTASGQCSVANQPINPSTGVSSATVAFTTTGNCTITASQAGTTATSGNAYNPATSVSGSFAIVSDTSTISSQTIAFTPIGSVRYGSTFTPVATASSNLPVAFTATGPCTTGGTVTGVGVCQITASQAGNSNVSPASVTQSFNVLPAELTVMANSPSIVYGQSLPALTYAYSGFVNNENASVINGAPSLSTMVTSASGVGSYPITVSQGTLAAANYDFLYVNGTLSITTANLTITAASGAMFYGGPVFPVTPGYGGFVNGNGVANLTTPAVCSTTATSVSNVGTYGSACSGATDPNYNISYVPGNVTITPASTTTTLTSSVNPSSYFQMVTFTAYVCPQFTGAPSGSVTFYNNGTALNGQQAAILESAAAGTPPCSNGVTPTVATFSTTTLPTGSNSITATYSGDSGANGDGLGDFSGGTASALNQVVNQAPVVQLNPLYVAFGNQNVNTTSSAAKVTLSNIGNTSLTIYSVSLAGSNASEFAISANTCGSSVAAGSTCTISITFIPVDTGLASASLQVFDNDEDNTSAQQIIALTGAGVSTISGPGSLYTDAIFAGSNSCGAITLSGNSSVDSFNSAQGYSASHTNSGGNVETNGNVTLNGSKSDIYGSATVPSATTGSCSSKTVTGLTSNGGGQATGGLVALSSAVNYPATPTITPAPPTTSQSISGSCPSGMTGCTTNGSKNVSLAPGAYGNVSVSGGTTVNLTKGTYNLNSLVLSGNSILQVGSGPVVINLAGASLSASSPALDLSGGSMDNPSSVPNNLQFTYGGSHGVNLSGGTSSYAAVYAPNAVVNMSGGTDFFGSIIAGTFTSSGNTALHYDKALPNIAGGSYLWFAVVVNNVAGLPTGSQAKVYLTDASVQYSVNGVAQPPIPVPNAVLTLNAAAFTSGTGAATAYDLTNNRWSTAIGSKSLTGNTFVTGVAIPVPAGGFPTGIQNVQFSVAFSTDVSGLTFNWQWGAAVYSSLNSTYASSSNSNLLGVNPEDGSGDINGSDIAGAPESYKAYLVPGAIGSGGTNYVGFLSTSAAVVPYPAPMTATPSSLLFAPQTQHTTSPMQTAVITNNDVVTHNFVTPSGATSPIYTSGTNSSDFALIGGANNCVGMASLASGASCTIYLTFTPSLQGGASESAKVVVNSDAKNSPQTVYLAGTGQ